MNMFMEIMEKICNFVIDNVITDDEIMEKITAEELKNFNPEQLIQRKKEIPNEIREERKQEKLELEEKLRHEQEERFEEYQSNLTYSVDDYEGIDDIENLSYDELKDLREKLESDLIYADDEQTIDEIEDKLREIKIHQRFARMEEKIESSSSITEDCDEENEKRPGGHWTGWGKSLKFVMDNS